MTPLAVAQTQTLDIAEGVSFGIDYVTKVCAILAQRRKGKSYCAAVIAEELYAASQPWVALDPTGAWWGLRSSADGEHPGIPVVVIGGQHGDLPLEPGAGTFVADLVLDHPGWYVIDLSLLEGRVAEREFSTAFAQRLHRRKMQPGMDFPLHLFVDEADLFLPQEKETKADVPLLAAYQGIVRRGGLHGLGVTIISQRPALVNKNALTQLDLLILLRLVAGNDQDAVDKNYVARATSKLERELIMGPLASLPVGTAIFFEPGADPKLLTTAKVRERRTFNSSATPKPGERRIEPRVLAEVDLKELGEQMRDAVERARENDPAEIRKRYEGQIAELQRVADEERRRADSSYGESEWRAHGWIPADEAPAPEPVPVLDESSARAFGTILERGEKIAAEMVEWSDGLVKCLADVADRVHAVALAPPPPVPQRSEPERSAPGIAADQRKREEREARSPVEGVTGPQQKILDGFAWWEVAGVAEPALGQVAFVVGNHPRSKGFTNNLSALSTAGLIARSPGRASLSAGGRRAANYPASTPTDAALQQMLYEKVGTKRSEILGHLIRRRNWVTVDELAEMTGNHPRSKGFTNNVSSLSGLGLVDRQPGRVRASDLCWIR